MISERIEFLFVKFMNDDINSSEMEELNIWTENNPNDERIAQYVNIHYTTSLATADKNRMRSLKDSLLKVEAKKKTYFFRYAVAAVVVLFTTSYLVNDIMNYQIEPVLELVDNTASENEITLKLADGSVKYIGRLTNGDSVGEAKIASNVKTDKQLTYDKTDLSIEGELVYNELTVPRGKVFSLELSDGTVVNLNSGSWIKYPERFMNNHKNREIFINGEAYFDVAKNKEHPFVVNSKMLRTTVLGTEFNFTAYDNDEVTSVVLVEGKVMVESEGSKTGIVYLKPNQRAYISKLYKTIINKEEVNVNKYIAWKLGEMLFADDMFSEIIEKLERKYNVSIESTYQELNNKRFTSRFSGNTIEEVLEVFKLHSSFEYDIKGSTIKIYNKKQ